MSTPELRRREALKFLIVARQADADPAVGVVYLTALADIAPEFLEAACHQLALQPREDYKPAMPDVGTIRALAEVVAREALEAARLSRLLPAPAARDDEPRFFCQDCLDEANGWAVAWCFGAGAHRVHPDAKPDRCARSPIASCGRDGLHGPHEWAHRCHCWQANPVIESRRQRAQGRKGQAA